MKPLPQIDKSWTLFLDRDGVINVERSQDYVKNIDEFIFTPKAPEAISLLNRFVNTIIVVTNQRGIGRGIMTESDLLTIHHYMQARLKEAEAHIHNIYFAPDLDDNAINRKPNIGMALQAKRDFPSIDFSKSIMVGNTLSDMEFGYRLGMYCVYIQSTHPMQEFDSRIDRWYDSLYDFAKDISKHNGEG